MDPSPPPSVDAPCWNDILLGITSPAFRTLAIQMLVFRLRQSVGQDSSPDNLAKARAELHALFTAQAHLPSVQRDLLSIQGSAP